MKLKFISYKYDIGCEILDTLNTFYLISDKKIRDFVICYRNKYTGINERYYLDEYNINKEYGYSDGKNYIYKVKLFDNYYILKIGINMTDANVFFEYDKDDHTKSIDPENNIISLLIKNNEMNNIKYIQLGNRKIYDNNFKIVHNNNLNIYNIIFDEDISDIESWEIKIYFEKPIQYKFRKYNPKIEYIKVL